MITTLPPDVHPEGRYSTTDAARVLGISRNTLRAHAAQGHISFGIRRCNGRRFYLGRHIMAFWKAYA